LHPPVQIGFAILTQRVVQSWIESVVQSVDWAPERLKALRTRLKAMRAPSAAAEMPKPGDVVGM